MVSFCHLCSRTLSDRCSSRCIRWYFCSLQRPVSKNVSVLVTSIMLINLPRRQLCLTTDHHLISMKREVCFGVDCFVIGKLIHFVASGVVGFSWQSDFSRGIHELDETLAAEPTLHPQQIHHRSQHLVSQLMKLSSCASEHSS